MSQANTFMASMLPWLFGAVAIFFCGATTRAVWTNRLAGAALFATMAFASVLLGYFPQLDSVKALAIDVKMRQSLDRADELLAKIKDLSIVSAQSSLFSVASTGLLFDTPIEKRREMANNILAQLDKLSVPIAEKKTAARPLIEILTSNFFSVYQTLVFDRYEQATAHANPAAVNALRTRLNDIHLDISRLDVDAIPSALHKAMTDVDTLVPIAPDDRNVFAKLLQKIDVLERDLVDNVRFSRDMVTFFKKTNAVDPTWYVGMKTYLLGQGD